MHANTIAVRASKICQSVSHMGRAESGFDIIPGMRSGLCCPQDISSLPFITVVLCTIDEISAQHEHAGLQQSHHVDCGFIYIIYCVHSPSLPILHDLWILRATKC